MGALRKGPYQAPGEQTAIIPGPGCGSVLRRAKLKSCRSFVIYLLLLQQVLRAFSSLTLPIPNSHSLSYFPSASTSWPPSPASLFRHNPAHVGSSNTLTWSFPPPLPQLPSSCGPRDWNGCFVLVSQTHKFKPASHVYRRQSAPCLFRAVLFLSFILSAGRNDLLEAGTRTSAY